MVMQLIPLVTFGHWCIMQVDRPMHAPPPAMPHPARNPELDWLRAYAVLLIVVLHLARLLGPDPGRFRVAFAALDFSGGVDLFFAISGFVIAGSLEPLWSPRPCGHRPGHARAIVWQFLVRRFWRLWPASTVWITYCLALSFICHGLGGWPPVGHVAWEWVTAVVPVYELREFRSPGVLGYYWTLSVEWQFYAVFPFLLVAIRSAGARTAALALVFGAGLYTNEISWMLRFSSIVAGIGIYAMHRSGRPAVAGRFASLRPWPRVWLTAALLCALVTLPQRAGSMLAGQLGLVVLCTILVTMAATGRGLVSDCGVPRLMSWIGLRSYSLYLCHIPVALTLSALLDRFGRCGGVNDVRARLGMLGLALAAALVLADLSYRHVELPWQRRHRSRRTAMVSPAG